MIIHQHAIHIFGRLSASALTAFFLIGSSMTAGAVTVAEDILRQRDLAVCNAWDVHITTLIEDYGRLNIVGPSDLAEAAFQQIQARVYCASGRAKQAVEIYERIDFPFCAEAECADAIRRE